MCLACFSSPAEFLNYWMVKGVKFLSRLLNVSCCDVITVPLFFSLLTNRPRPLSSFDTHARWVARNTKRSISMILRKNRGLWTVYITMKARNCSIGKWKWFDANCHHVTIVNNTVQPLEITLVSFHSHTFFDNHAICRNYIPSETKSLSGNFFLVDNGHIFLLYFTEWGKDT